jgi:hypothetical protein
VLYSFCLHHTAMLRLVSTAGCGQYVEVHHTTASFKTSKCFSRHSFFFSFLEPLPSGATNYLPVRLAESFVSRERALNYCLLFHSLVDSKRILVHPPLQLIIAWMLCFMTAISGLLLWEQTLITPSASAHEKVLTRKLKLL